jgi:hypothetical protein
MANGSRFINCILFVVYLTALCLLSGELEWIWKEAIVSWFEVDPLLRLSGKTEGSFVKIYQDGVSLGLEPNLCPPEYEVIPARWRLL